MGAVAMDGGGKTNIGAAIAVSALVHAAVLAFVPGWRGYLPEALRTLDVRLVLAPPAQRTEPVPVAAASPQPVHRPASPHSSSKAPRPHPAPPPRIVAQNASQASPEAMSMPTPAQEAGAVPTPEPRRVEQPVAGGRLANAAPTDAVSAKRTETDFDALIGQFGRDLARALEAQRRYPQVARMRGWQGAVQLDIQVLPGGQLGTVGIARSSGYPVLDQTALAMLQGDLPDVPDSLRRREFHVPVRIEFRLQN